MTRYLLIEYDGTGRIVRAGMHDILAETEAGLVFGDGRLRVMEDYRLFSPAHPLAHEVVSWARDGRFWIDITNGDLLEDEDWQAPTFPEDEEWQAPTFSEEA